MSGADTSPKAALSEGDKLAIDTLSAHVVSPTEARIFAPLANPARSREVFVIAKADNLMEAFAGRGV